MREAHRGLILRSAEDRFWDKVDKSNGPDKCWLWTGAVSKDPKNAYGHFYWNGRSVKAHRASYELLVAPIPDGLQVLHNCPDGDNPRCVNPSHLFVGTQGDNIQDAWRKGRFKGNKGYTHNEQARKRISSKLTGVSKTEEHKKKIRETKRRQSPLDLTKVAEIRHLRAEGWTYKRLADKFGVCTVSILNIVKGRTWN